MKEIVGHRRDYRDMGVCNRCQNSIGMPVGSSSWVHPSLEGDVRECLPKGTTYRDVSGNIWQHIIHAAIPQEQLKARLQKGSCDPNIPFYQVSGTHERHLRA
jgi:hypothetical protein